MAPALLAAFEKKLIDGLVWPSPIPEIVEFRGLGKTVVDPFSGEVPELNGVPISCWRHRVQAGEKSQITQAHAMRAILGDFAPVGGSGAPPEAV